MSVFYGGVPTQPDVDKLMKLECQPGTQRPLADLASVVGVGVETYRFRSIMNAWRKRLFRERGLQTKEEKGEMHFLTADQAHDAGYRRFRLIGRAAGRHRVKLEAVQSNELTGERKDKHTLLVREARALQETAARSQKEIAAPAAVSGSTLRLAKG